MIKKKNRGFTLIELLVVIAIIGILSSVVLTSLNSARKKARDARRQSDISQIALAMNMYYDDNDAKYYSAAAMPTKLDPTNGIYLNPVPADPGPNTYTWLDNTGDATAQSFCLYATLEMQTATDKYVAASQKGVGKALNTPTLASCW